MKKGLIIAIIVLVVGALVLGSVLLFVPNPSSSPANKEWHDAGNFNGVETENTASFNIQGNQSKITYTLVPNQFPESSFFNLFIYPEGETSVYTDTIALGEGKASGTNSSTFSLAPGDYYFKVIVANLDSWDIQVQDYY
ncbi:MAG: hypothetical protein PHH00_02115 [Candidatus Nanoarchaeia archaeon]|nr:hypothetical protein [Candidatus Nanoarchaeia archaeon]